MSYGIAKRVSKSGDNFGKGEIEGVVAPETAAHAAGTAALLPMLSLGVPGSPTAAVLLGGLLIWGLQPGPMLFVEQKEFVWGLIASMYLGNLVGLIIVLTCVPVLAAILRIPFSIIAPIILVLCAIGAYTVNNNSIDVIMMMVFGVIGYVLKKCDYPLAPLVLAMVLGKMAEEAFRQSLLSSQGNLGIFFSNGLVSSIMVLGLIALFWSLIQEGFTRLRPRPPPEVADAGVIRRCIGDSVWNIVFQTGSGRRQEGRIDQSSVRPATRVPGRIEPERHLVQLQEQGLCGAEKRHRLDGYLSSRTDIRLDERQLARISASAAPRCARRWRNSSVRALSVRCRAAASMSCARPRRK